MSLESILIRKGSLIDVGERRIARVGSKKERYLIYLPIERNYIWRRLWESGRIRVYIEIVDVESKQ
ncbi:MAG: hypothetical protein QXL22_04785 [Candidatus Nezhaarchaeales archaeon]|uniref:hypothetical protein n=1 Tax=Thermofilum sp. TaxID=1961369 RepID=UPI003165FC20